MEGIINNSFVCDVIQYRELLPAGLARRLSGRVDQSVQNLTKPDDSGNPRTKVEFRILNFEIAK